jgi:O-antigen ligase
MAYLLFDRRSFTQADRPLLKVGVALPVLLGTLIGVLQILPAPGESQVARTSAAAVAVSDRLSTFTRLNSDFTVNTRVQDARWAVNDWLESPLLGRGTGSFKQIHGTRVGTEAWISNLVLHTLVDTGLVGLVIQLSLFGLVVWRAWQAASATRDPGLAIGLKAMTLGLLVIAIAYQVTDGTWLAVFWVHLGLVVNGIYCARADAHATA